MKKLILNKANFAGATLLTREQLKKVMGGDGPETTGPYDPFSTTDANDWCTGTHDAFPCYCASPSGSFFAGCLTSSQQCDFICND